GRSWLNMELTPGGPPPSFESDNHFPSSVSLLQIPDRRRDLTQAVTPVDDRCHLSALHEIGQGGQVLFFHLRQHHAHLLAHEPCHHPRGNHARQRIEPAAAFATDHDVFPLWV